MWIHVGELSHFIDPITLYISLSSCYTFTTGSLNLTGTLLNFFLIFFSSNFHWYQFNSYIYVKASQVHILLQNFPPEILIYLLVFLLNFPVSLSSWLKPVTNFLLWFSVSLRTLFQFLGLKQGQTSFLFPLQPIQWVIKFLTNSF